MLVGRNDVGGNDGVSWVEEKGIDVPSMATERVKLATDILN